MSDGFDIAMQNFTANTLRGMRTGGGLGASNGSQQLTIFKDATNTLDNLPEKMAKADIFSHVGGKLLEGMQGFASSVSLESFSRGFSPPSSPIGSDSKIPGIISTKGRG